MIDIKTSWFDEPMNLFKTKNDYMRDLGTKKIIHPSVEITGDVVIEGPCYIGPNTRLGPFSYIRSGTYIEGSNHIGMSEIKNSILLKGSNAPHFNYIGDSIVGRNVNFGAGAKVVNLRLDKKHVRVLDEEFRKFGSIVGDDTQLGINVNLRPGEIIEPGSHVYVDDNTGKRVIQSRQ